MPSKDDSPHSSSPQDTTPATGLSATPGDYGFAVGSPIGRYVVLERIGGGGMGIVYSAYDPKLDRRVALKLLRPDVSPDAQPRLLREGQTLARLAHPNVVNVHDVGEFDGRVFVDMEFVKGSTLTRWLEASPRSVREVLDVFLQAGRGLAAAHAVGIVHRDFKPDNVLVGDDGRVRVADFGIAMLSGVDAPSNVAHGTPLYMAPEQTRGGGADARSDQWSFCLSLVEALTGQHPLAGVAPGARPSEIGLPRSPRIPLWLRPVLARGLRADPGARFPSTDALLAALSRDPRTAWTRGVALATLLAVVAVGMVGYTRMKRARSLVCANGEDRLAGVWDDARRREASAAFTATGKPFSAAAWQSARASLDDYAREWARTYVDACEATHVRGEQSAELLDLRMACLGDRRKDMGALVEVLVHADVPVVTNALSAAHALPQIEACSDVRALRSGVKAPDPAKAAEVKRIGDELSAIKALTSAGKQRDVVARAHELVAAADATGYLPLEAEALLADGVVRDKNGDYAGADAALFRAARAADAAGDDRLRVSIYGRLLDVVGLREAKHDLVPILFGQAEAALARVGSYDEGRAHIDQAIAGVLLEEGKLDDAFAADQRALALWQKLRGPESRETARVLGNMGVVQEGLGKADDALASYEQALAIETKVLGPEHPDVVTELHNIANIHQAKLEFREAAAGFERAVAVAEASLGPDHPMLAECLDGLGEAVAELGEYERAVKLHERALAIKDKALQPDNPQLLYTLVGLGDALLKQPHPDPARAAAVLERALALPSTGFDDDAAEVEFGLARALAQGGKSHARAHDLATRARDTFRKNATLPAEKQMLAEVEAWLAANP